MESNISPVTNFDDIEDIEILQSRLKEMFICEIINARKEKKLSQKQLSLICGVQQPVIAKLERGQAAPTLTTLMKILTSLGKTMQVVDLPVKEPIQEITFSEGDNTEMNVITTDEYYEILFVF